ncbi:MAG: MMPL family transporter, partial [Gammaproteobacteria bacterium]|nr:MMPL family transporter [Gammaproteobacteria bacterium]
FWFIKIQAADSFLAQSLRNDFRQRLESTDLFSFVENGLNELTIEGLPKPLWDKRYLLIDEDFSIAGIDAAIKQRVPDFLLGLDAGVEAMIGADPYLAAMDVLERSSPIAVDEAPNWISSDGGFYLIAESQQPAFDMEAQQLIAATVADLAAEFNLTQSVYGVGAYGASLKQSISGEAQYRSILASILVVLVLLFMYRRSLIVLLGVVPLALGALSALAAVTLAFGKVHGITLAFGFTLLGVAIDYPLHVFSHMRGGVATIKSIWPTMRIGALSTVLAFLAISISGSSGLAQLGLFSAVGVATALLVSVTLLPAVIRYSHSRVSEELVPGARRNLSLRHWGWLPLLILGSSMLVYKGASLWTDDLSTLTPLSKEVLVRDQSLRKNFGAPDIRYLILLKSSSKEILLQQTEALALQLSSPESGVEFIQSVSDLVPSLASQQRRYAAALSLSPATVEQSAAAAGFVAGTFQLFVDHLEFMRLEPEYVTEADYLGTPFQDIIESRLYQRDGDWYSVSLLAGLSSETGLQQALATSGFDALLVDLKAASGSLLATYRQQVLKMLGWALLVIAGLLFIELGAAQRLVWIAGTLAASVTFTLGLTGIVLGSLNVFNLVAVVLIAGLGLDYALFLSHTGSSKSTGNDSVLSSRHAISASFLSTAAGFCALSFSSVPMLSGLGVTVLIGVLAAYFIARIGISDS